MEVLSSICFMSNLFQRIASGCNSKRHPLYSIFMSRLSRCIFVWDAEDMALLITAKRSELEGHGIKGLTNQEVERRLSRREKALHCRRTTRSAADIVKNIQQLVDAMNGPQGRDTVGEPLFNTFKINTEWHNAKQHLCCILDPPDVPLFMQTGTMKKGGVQLPILRSARGSTSLESFHLHLNRFIPGLFTTFLFSFPLG